MKLRTVENSKNTEAPDFLFWCPGCKSHHGVWTTRANGLGARWGFNGSMEAPTFTPSLLVNTHEWQPPVTPENLDEWRKKEWPQTRVEKVCHSYITDGRIQYLGDCTHALAGQTIAMEDVK